MERLSKRDENGNAYYDFGFLNSNHWARGKHVDRLADYEDTGIEPEDFKKVSNEDAVYSEPKEEIVDRLVVSDDGASIICRSGYKFRVDRIGKTVFLTREAAKAALEASPHA